MIWHGYAPGIRRIPQTGSVCKRRKVVLGPPRFARRLLLYLDHLATDGSSTQGGTKARTRRPRSHPSHLLTGVGIPAKGSGPRKPQPQNPKAVKVGPYDRAVTSSPRQGKGRGLLATGTTEQAFTLQASSSPAKGRVPRAGARPFRRTIILVFRIFISV